MNHSSSFNPMTLRGTYHQFLVPHHSTNKRFKFSPRKQSYQGHKQFPSGQKTMKKSENESEVEILKAVAQAWHGHSSSSKTEISEFDARRLNFKNKPTRFKLEAMGVYSREDSVKSWDFGQSLWDSYEIVTVSKRLETGLLLENPFSASDEQNSAAKRRKESSNSLRKLFNRTSSRRFNKR